MANEQSYDVIVIGSGAAGLSAALCASANGSRVLVLEKSALIGGTTALSGGGIWVPCHHHQAGIGATDSREDALAYIRAIAPQGWHNVEEPLWVAFVDHAPEMLAFLESKSPLRFAPSLEPDPYVEAPGGKRFGRMLSPRPISARCTSSRKGSPAASPRRVSCSASVSTARSATEAGSSPSGRST